MATAKPSRTRAQRAQKPQNKASAKLAGDLRGASKTEAQKLADIRASAFAKGQRMAARASAKRAGFEAGLKAGGVK